MQAVPGNITRPITDRVKEALFNIIGSDIEDASLLDLFAGTGSVGIEALSRGASYVRLIDTHRAAIATIKANLHHTHLEDHAEVFQVDAFVHLQQPPSCSFDYIYIAPPQYKGVWQRALLSIDQNSSWLSPNAWIIAQIDPVEYQAQEFIHFYEFDQRKYGSTLLVFYRTQD